MMQMQSPTGEAAEIPDAGVQAMKALGWTALNPPTKPLPRPRQSRAKTTKE